MPCIGTMNRSGAIQSAAGPRTPNLAEVRATVANAPPSWSAREAKPPRRFGFCARGEHEAGGSHRLRRSIQSAVAAALCRRTPKTWRAPTVHGNSYWAAAGIPANRRRNNSASVNLPALTNCSPAAQGACRLYQPEFFRPLTNALNFFRRSARCRLCLKHQIRGVLPVWQAERMAELVRCHAGQWFVNTPGHRAQEAVSFYKNRFAR